jgi:hypothetical protein
MVEVIKINFLVESLHIIILKGTCFREGSLMNKGKLLTLLLGILFATVLASQAEADILTGYASGNLTGFEYNDQYSGYSTNSPQTITLDIVPFDTTLGTLNSVTMFAEVNASGSLVAWYYGFIDATLTYSLSNTLAVTEMGDTVASDTGTTRTMDGGDPDNGVYNPFAPVNANNYTITTLTSGFGRFLTGPDPFQVSLTLTGSALSSNPAKTDVYFDFDGEARLEYVYNYTPGVAAPVPAACWLFGSGLIGLVGLRRKFHT